MKIVITQTKESPIEYNIGNEFLERVIDFLDETEYESQNFKP